MNPPIPEAPIPIQPLHVDRLDRIYVINGTAYRWSGWFGCQLESIEWHAPKHGRDGRRSILGWDFVPFMVERHGLRKRVTWCLLELSGRTPANASEVIFAFRRELLGSP